MFWLGHKVLEAIFFPGSWREILLSAKAEDGGGGHSHSVALCMFTRKKQEKDSHD